MPRQEPPIAAADSSNSSDAASDAASDAGVAPNTSGSPESAGEIAANLDHDAAPNLCQGITSRIFSA